MPATTWNRPLRYLMLSALLGGLLWLAISFRAILNPLLVAALLAYLLNPAVGFVKTITRLNQKWASTLVYLASSEEVEGVSGKYFVRKKEVKSSAISYNAEIARRLWDTSEKLTGFSWSEILIN